MWILTGDFGSKVGIYKAKNNFESVEPIKLGKQKYRSCVAFPTKLGLLYATDSQFIQNSIRLLYKKKDRWITKIIHKINGPSVYGAMYGAKFFFSTAVEPVGIGYSKGNYGAIKFLSHLFTRERSPAIKENKSFIIGGDFKNGFGDYFKYEKDIMPFTLFQFGI